MKAHHKLESESISWVKKELYEVLNQTRSALEAYVEEDQDPSKLNEIKDMLHQVQGTMQIMDLHGAALLAKEMEELAQALIDDAVKSKEDVYEVLLRAILQLPDYLEHIQAGNKDIPIILLPLFNDMRSARGADLLSEKFLFFPQFDSTIVPRPEHQSTTQADNPVTLAKKTRHIFQLGLLGWFRGKDLPASLTKMHKVTALLYRSAQIESSRRLWWVATAIFEALSLKGLELSITLNSLLGQVDRQIKQLIDVSDEEKFAELIPDELVKNLLYYIACAEDKGDLVRTVKTTFALQELLPDESLLEELRERLSAPNEEVLSTVAGAIHEDLADVKDNLEIFARKDNKDSQELDTLIQKLHQIGDTLGMLGLSESREKVMEEAGLVNSIVMGEENASETAIMNMAGVMVNVESSIENFITSNRSGSAQDGAEETKGSIALGEQQQIPDAEYQKLRESVVSEALADIQFVKDTILNYIALPNEKEQISQVPDHLVKLSGALTVAGIGKVSSLVRGIGAYISSKILAGNEVPDNVELESLADAITGVEYYLESIGSGINSPESVLDASLKSVAQLGLTIDEQGQEDSAVGDGAKDTSGAIEAESKDGKTIDIIGGESQLDVAKEDSVVMENPAEKIVAGIDDTPLESCGAETLIADTQIYQVDDQLSQEQDFPALTGGVDTETVIYQVDDQLSQKQDFPALTGGVDAETVIYQVDDQLSQKQDIPVLTGEVDTEILEIFLEEAAEEVDNIKKLLPQWESDKDNQEALSTIRRSFHTIKGSGRLVGAQLIGEFAWAYEDLLNRVLDRKIQINVEFFEALRTAVKVLPQLIAQLKGERQPDLDPIALMEQVHALSLSGQSEEPSETHKKKTIDSASRR